MEEALSPISPSGSTRLSCPPAAKWLVTRLYGANKVIVFC
jgi:hypothetical protein